LTEPDSYFILRRHNNTVSRFCQIAAKNMAHLAASSQTVTTRSKGLAAKLAGAFGAPLMVDADLGQDGAPPSGGRNRPARCRRFLLSIRPADPPALTGYSAGCSRAVEPSLLQLRADHLDRDAAGDLGLAVKGDDGQIKAHAKNRPLRQGKLGHAQGKNVDVFHSYTIAIVAGEPPLEVCRLLLHGRHRGRGHILLTLWPTTWAHSSRLSHNPAWVCRSQRPARALWLSHSPPCCSASLAAMLYSIMSTAG